MRMLNRPIVVALLFIGSLSLHAMEHFCFALKQMAADTGPASAVCELADEEGNLTKEERIRRAHYYEILGRRLRGVCVAGAKCSVAIGASNYLMSNPNFLMFAGLIGMGFRDKIEGSISSLQRSLWPTNEMKSLEDIELDLKLNDGIPEKRAQKIRERISQLRSAVCDTSRIFNDNGNDPKRAIQSLIKTVALPTSNKQLLCVDYCKKINDAMEATYDQKLVEDLKLMIFGIVERSKSTSEFRGAKPAYFFIGVPGTGKTATANLIADCLGLPFFRINLAENSSESLCARRQVQGSNNASEEAKITECFLNGKALNCLFFFDEVHDVLRSSNPESARYQSVLKNLLTGESYFDEGLQTEVDTRNAIFIFAANKKMDDAAGALLNRMDCFEFSPAKVDARTTIANKFLKDARAKYSASEEIISRQDQVYKDIIQYDANKCQNEGVRGLERVIDKYVLFRMASHKGIINQKKFDVEAEFAIALGKAADKYN